MKLILEFVNVEDVNELYSCITNLTEDLQKLDPALSDVKFDISQEEDVCICEIHLGEVQKDLIVTKEVRNIHSIVCQAKSQSRKVIQKNRKERQALKLKRNKLLLKNHTPVIKSKTNIREFDFSAN